MSRKVNEQIPLSFRNRGIVQGWWGCVSFLTWVFLLVAIFGGLYVLVLR